MRRFCTFVILLLFSLPFGAAVSGCHKATAVTFCNGQDSGFVVGQVTTVTLTPANYGVSLNYGEIRGQVGSPSATDCRNQPAAASSFTYATSDMTIADINPSTGQLCGGTWNRNTGSGTPDFTTCTPTGKTGTAYTTASAAGVTSNAVPVFVHPVATSIVLGPPSTNCLTDPASNCSPSSSNVSTISTCTVNPANGCCVTPATVTPYTGSACLSQGHAAQLVTRVFQNGTTNPSDNISCFAGHVIYTPQTSSIVTIDQNGLATANQPGSTAIAATLSNASSAGSNSAGFFSTCPPASISLAPVSGTTPVNVAINNSQPLNQVVTDTNGNLISSITLEYVSTAPTIIPGPAGDEITPTFPGSATLYAICQPPACNPSPFNEIGLYGNGLTVVSNPVQVNAPGNDSTVLVLGSTNSRYLTRFDFTQTTQSAPVQLPYVPNSMVLSQDLSTVYLGNQNEMMVVSSANLALTGQYPAVQGIVLAVSPDNATVVVADPTRNLTSLYSNTGTLNTQIGGVGTHAVWTPDSQTVYITAGNQILVHAVQTGWHTLNTAQANLDTAVTVPSVGAYFAGLPTTAVSNCPVTTLVPGPAPQVTTNNFYPPADLQAKQTDRIAATNDGKHILGGTANGGALTITDLQVNIPTGSCPPAGQTFAGTNPFTIPAPAAVKPTAITGVVPSTDSAVAFFTYTGTGGVLPVYKPGVTGQPGTVTNLPLVTATGQPAPTAVIAGVISTDNLTFYAATAGDNAIHLITRSATGSTYTDSNNTLFPKLPDTTPAGAPTAINLIVQRPRPLT